MIREERRKKRRRKHILIGFLTTLLILALAALIVIKVFTVKNVEVEGNKLYSDEQIKEWVLNDDYSWNTLYVYFKYRFFDTQKVPFIDTMEVSVKSPHTLHVEVYEKGLLGHSDADVLLHAIMDAMLGAAAMGDIGKHFPDTDPKYEGASSLELLKRVGELLEEELYVVENIDATIIAQKPKMAPHIPKMRENIAKTLGLELDQINIKATTEEGLGFTGSGEGISSQAICSLEKMTRYSVDVTPQEGCAGCPGCGR